MKYVRVLRLDIFATGVLRTLAGKQKPISHGLGEGRRQAHSRSICRAQLAPQSSWHSWHSEEMKAARSRTKRSKAAEGTGCLGTGGIVCGVCLLQLVSCGVCTRSSIIVLGHSTRCWHVLVTDVFEIEAVGPTCRPALVIFFVVCAVCGVPLSRNKAWVGFELLHRSHQLGMSARVPEWVVRWSKEIAELKTVNKTTYEEGLGRTMHVAGAFEP